MYNVGYYLHDSVIRKIFVIAKESFRAWINNRQRASIANSVHFEHVYCTKTFLFAIWQSIFSYAVHNLLENATGEE